MSRSFTATMLRAIRLMRPREQVKTARKINKAMIGFTVPSVFAALRPKPAKSRKVAAPNGRGPSFAARSLPAWLIIFQGTADSTVHPGNVAMSDRPGFAARQGGAKTVSYARNWRRERPLAV